MTILLQIEAFRSLENETLPFSSVEGKCSVLTRKEFMARYNPTDPKSKPKDTFFCEYHFDIDKLSFSQIPTKELDAKPAAAPAAKQAPPMKDTPQSQTQRETTPKESLTKEAPAPKKLVRIPSSFYYYYSYLLFLTFFILVGPTQGSRKAAKLERRE